MPIQTVKCDACGADATVTFMDGLLFPDPRYPDANIVLTIKCPNCGVREQPAEALR
jgi:hypothetical protein